jgi:CDP-4-dehydro-6-deoxyglucose reductase
MPTIHLANDKTFDAAAGVSVLDAARQAGLVLEHSCRSGRCGSCKARLLGGRVTALKPDLALSAAEREAGWALTCISAAASDLELDIEDLGLPADLTARTLPCRIDSIERLAADIAVVRLRLPPTAALRWLAGQYVDVIGPGGVRRSYSIANDAAADPAKLELHVRRVEGGVLSDYWFGRAQSNDLLRLHGPLGTFFLRDTAGLHLVLLATGTGIAPIKALLGELALRPAAQQPRSVALWWGNRHAADLYWSPDTVLRGEAEPALAYTPVLSRADAAWTGARGHVQQVLLQRPYPWAETVVYACGSPAMIDGARAALTAAGLPARRFLSDAFVSSD